MTDGLKLELGGGTSPREGYLNVDCRRDLRRVDIPFDLEQCMTGWDEAQLPIADESVSDVYSSHCLEHVANLDGVLWELARVCQNGATIEIRVPHYLHPDALCPSHKHVISENVVKGWCKRDFAGKRFDLVTSQAMRNPSVFDEARELHPGWKDDQIMRFVPGAAFELRYILRVRRAS